MKQISQSSERKIGAVLSYVQIAISALSGLLVTPIILRLMGQNEYGLYGTVSSTISLLGLLDLGFTSSYIRFFSKYKVENRPDKINSFNSLFFIVFSIIAAIALLLGIFVSLNPKFVFENGLTAVELEKARIMMIILTCSTAFGFFTTVFSCFVSANQKFVYIKCMAIVSAIVGAAVNIFVLWRGYGAVGLVFSTVLLTVVFKFVTIAYSKRLDFRFDFKHIEKHLFKSVLAFSGLIAINMLVDQVNSGIDRILLGRFCGTAAVAVYSVGASLKSHFQTFSTAISGVFTPRIHEVVNSYEMDSSEQRKAITEIFVKVGRVQYLLLALIASGVVFFGKQFIRFWAGEGYEDSYVIALLLIIPSIIPLIQNVGIEIQRAENRHHYRAYIYGAMAVFNLIISIFLCQILEGIGAALGTGIATLVANGLIMNVVYHKKINIDVIEFWKNILKQTLGMLVPFAAGILIMIFADTSSIVKLAFWIIIYTAVYCAFVWMFAANRSEKELILGALKKLRKAR